MTPLMYGAQLGDCSIVTALLKGGAVFSLTTHQGHTAARIAQDAGFPAVATAITQWALQGMFKNLYMQILNHEYTDLLKLCMLLLQFSLLANCTTSKNTRSLSIVKYLLTMV